MKQLKLIANIQGLISRIEQINISIDPRKRAASQPLATLEERQQQQEENDYILTTSNASMDLRQLPIAQYAVGRRRSKHMKVRLNLPLEKFNLPKEVTVQDETLTIEDGDEEDEIGSAPHC
jgi:hypothetical protein